MSYSTNATMYLISFIYLSIKKFFASFFLPKMRKIKDFKRNEKWTEPTENFLLVPKKKNRTKKRIRAPVAGHFMLHYISFLIQLVSILPLFFFFNYRLTMTGASGVRSYYYIVYVYKKKDIITLSPFSSFFLLLYFFFFFFSSPQMCGGCRV